MLVMAFCYPHLLSAECGFNSRDTVYAIWLEKQKLDIGGYAKCCEVTNDDKR